MRSERIGRFEVLETLASGGMGVVYKARDPVLDRIVAVKTLGAGLSPIEAESFRTRFAREAKSAGRLNHPNIVTIHDMGERDDGGAYIAMEFLEGRTLRDIVDSGVVLKPSSVADIAIQVAEGLAFAHRNGVIHCDIKPANVMVLESGVVKIMDFGIARLPTGSRTFAGNVLGSPRYISPEQIVGRPIDARSDLFALGAVIYELLVGVPPFAGQAIDEILYQVINEKPPPPSQRNPELPAAFDAIVERAMAKHPDDRYATADEMAAALRKVAVEFEGDHGPLMPPAPRPAAPVSPGARTVELGATGIDAGARSRRRLAWASGAVAIAALAIVAVRAMREPPAQIVDLSTNSSAATPVGDARAVEPPPRVATPAREPVRPTVIPPLDARGAAEAAPAPFVESNTVPAPSMVPVPSAAAPVSAQGRIGLAISPWGEVYVDGRKRGVTPPLSELKLPPGRYVVEIRNAGFAPLTQTVELAADQKLRIKHKFQ